MRIFPHPRKTKVRLLKEYKGKRILDISNRDKGVLFQKDPHLNEYLTSADILSKTEVMQFPWALDDNSYDLILCQNIFEHIPDTLKALQECNRIAAPGAKIYIEAPHYTCFEAYRHLQGVHHFSACAFDYFLKGNPHAETDFRLENKKIYFDDLTYLSGVGFLANFFPKLYEKRLAFIFPATSFSVTFKVDKT